MTASDADPLGLAWFPNSILVHKRFPAQLVPRFQISSTLELRCHTRSDSASGLP
jgi:hypothetical protein